MSYAIKFNVAKAKKLAVKLPKEIQRRGSRCCWWTPLCNLRWVFKGTAHAFSTVGEATSSPAFAPEYMDVIDLDTNKVVRPEPTRLGPISDAIGKAAADKRKSKVQQHVAGRYALKFNIDSARNLGYILPLAIHMERSETWWSSAQTQRGFEVLWTKVEAVAIRFKSIEDAQQHRHASEYAECLDVIDLDTGKVVPSKIWNMGAVAEAVGKAAARSTTTMTAAKIRQEWRAAGGSIHGPNVETVTMTEADYFKFRRSLSK